MYKLLIVDDEFMVIESISNIVHKFLPQIQVVGTAENGRKAIELAEELRPDLILIDIEMPGINGLEAIREIKKRLKCHFVVISAYDYFSYAKEAITEGVLEYILKPFNKEEIMGVLNKFISNIENEKGKRKDELLVREKLNNTRTLLIDEIVDRLVFYNGNNNDELIKYLEVLDINPEYGYCFIISVLEAIPQHAVNRMQGIVKSSFKCFTGFIPDKNILAFIPLSKEQQDKISGVTILENLHRVYESIKKNCKTEVLIGAGQIHEGLKGMNSSFKEALEVIRHSKKMRGIVLFKDLGEDQTVLSEAFDSNLQKMNELERSFLSKLRMGDTDESMKAFGKLYATIEIQCKRDYSEMKNRLLEVVVHIFSVASEENVKNHVSRLNYKSYINEYLSVDSINKIHTWVREVIEYICENIEYDAENTVTIAEQAKKIIMENYNGEISQEEVAKRLHISSSYLSRLFKELIGENFVDYVTRLKIEKSLDLLENTNMNVKEISYKLGYNDPNYFCKVFKKFTGHTPSTFRNASSGSEAGGSK